jgi:lipopolysaccharide export system protein LptA
MGMRVVAGGLFLAACVAMAAPKAKRVRAQEPVKLGTFSGYAKGGLDIVPGDKLTIELHGGVAITSPSSNIAGDEMVVTMAKKGKDLETAAATGNVKIVTRQPGDRVITSTSDKGVLNNVEHQAVLSGNVLVRVDDPQNPMVITGAQSATIDLTSKRISVRPGPGGQVHFEGTVPAPAPKKGK